MWCSAVLCVCVITSTVTSVDGAVWTSHVERTLPANNDDSIRGNDDDVGYEVIDLDGVAEEEGPVGVNFKSPHEGMSVERTSVDDLRDEDEISISDADSVYLYSTKENQQNTGISNKLGNDTSADADVTDDEDLAAGSGSGDVTIQIEDGAIYVTSEVNTVTANTTHSPTFDPDDEVADEAEQETTDEFVMFRAETSTTVANGEEADIDTVKGLTTGTTVPDFCEEIVNATWSLWSPWIQSGDADVRFRSCHADHGYETSVNQCLGDSVETRPCRRRDVKTCRTSLGDVTEEYHLQCDGIHFDDIQSVDEVRHPQERTDKCQYTLYDLKYGMAIGKSLSSPDLAAADPALWCRTDDKYVPFYTPTQRCMDNLKAFCKSTETCRYDRKQQRDVKSKGDLRRRCWEQFVIGGVQPEGIPDNGGHQMICQRFDKEGRLGKALGHREEHFATVYDTFQRMPVVSMATVRTMGDSKWPNVPLMIDRALIKDDSGVISWFFKERKKGMARVDEVTGSCDVATCQLGERQALPADYDYSGYRPMPLVTPDVIGGSLAARISTLTVTNTVPLEPTVYAVWKNVLTTVRKFALTECRIPEVSNKGDDRKSRNGHELPEMYLVSGAIVSYSHVDVIGNDVTVPKIIWLAACCAHGAHVASFGVYAYNEYNQRPMVMSVQNLQALLQSNYQNADNDVIINLFPAFDGVCSAIENDHSFNIVI